MSELPLNIYYQCCHGNRCKSFLLVEGFQLAEIQRAKCLGCCFHRLFEITRNIKEEKTHISYF